MSSLTLLFSLYLLSLSFPHPSSLSLAKDSAKKTVSLGFASRQENSQLWPSGSRGLWFSYPLSASLISENSASGHAYIHLNLHQFLQETFIPNMLYTTLPHPSFICRLTGYSVRIFPMSHTVLGAKDPRVMVGFPCPQQTDVLGEETSTGSVTCWLKLINNRKIRYGLLQEGLSLRIRTNLGL